MLCRRCNLDKAHADFPAHKAYASGHSTWCRECHRQASREWYKANKKKQGEKSRAWRLANAEAANIIDNRYKQRNRGRLAASNAEWGRNNRDKRRATTAKRKAAKLRATPSWANHDEIARIYRLAQELQELTGVAMHVDHVVPLQHPFVCGLHCERNLQIVPARFNEGKKNYWWPDMPDELRKAYSQPDIFIEAAKREQPVQHSIFEDDAA